jgi:hypothetical protein
MIVRLYVVAAFVPYSLFIEDCLDRTAGRGVRNWLQRSRKAGSPLKSFRDWCLGWVGGWGSQWVDFFFSFSHCVGNTFVIIHYQCKNPES